MSAAIFPVGVSELKRGAALNSRLITIESIPLKAQMY
jgi:hypothetical protein